MSVRLAIAVVTACLCTTSASAQPAAPNLTKPQRDLLQAIVDGVDGAAAQPAITDATWQIHVLRASDGSHYIAMSVTPPAALLSSDPVTVYVRLATATSGSTVVAERSLVRE